MVKRLAASGLLEHELYRGASLTTEGRRIALEVVRHHRLLETYLAEKLGVSWDAVHDEADRLEHHLSEAVEARIAEALGHPTHDPHGDPIPSAALELEREGHRSLVDVPDGDEAVVRRVPDEAPVLRYLAELGLRPASAVRVLTRAPFGGPLTIEVDGERHAIAADLAARIG